MTNGQPIRVLQAVPSMGHGGIEHFLMNLYRAIDKNKVQFDFMYRVSYECVFDKEIDAMGGRIFRCVDPDRHPVRSGRFYRSFFAEHPEFCAVHEHRSGCDGFFGLMRAAKHAGVPIRILHSHNSQKGWAYNPVKDLTDAFNAPRLAAFANTFVACSDVAATYLYGRCPKAFDACVVRPNAIDLSAFVFNPSARADVRERYGIDHDALVVGHVGRFVSEKNQVFLVEVVSRLRSDGVRAEALLLGDGPLRDKVSSKADSLGISQYVHFAGIQEDTASHYSAMDVFCMPSLFEGLPVSCVEAQASGLPMVLSADISHMADICGHTAFLELNESASSWGNAIRAAAEGGRHNGTSALRTAGYDIATAAQEFERLYLSGVSA